MIRDLPLRWMAPAAPDDPVARARANASVIQFLGVLESDGGAVNTTESEPPVSDLQRLESKVDALLELVTQLWVRGDAALPHRRVWLSNAGVEWLDPSPPETGSTVELSLYMSTRFPQPLRLSVAVVGVEREASVFRVQSRFGDIDAMTRNYLEKLIFREHRRAVAEARRQRSGVA